MNIFNQIKLIEFGIIPIFLFCTICGFIISIIVLFNRIYGKIFPKSHFRISKYWALGISILLIIALISVILKYHFFI
ncbi:MAG: hypothetical protein RLZZ175_2346 [Bacteroidota bacterium]|jgi:hypothetical protein